MAKSIELQDDDLAILVEVHRKRLAEAQEDKKNAEIREKAAIDKLAALGFPVAVYKSEPFADLMRLAVSNIDVKLHEYRINETIIGKIKYVLTESGKEMTTSQIIERLIQLDETYRNDPRKSAKNVSSVLSVNHGAGKPFKRTEDANGTYFFSMNK